VEERRHIMFRTFLGIAIVAVAALAAGGAGEVSAGGGCHSDRFTDGSGVAVELSQNCFSPTVIRTGAGETVTWTNADLGPHTVTGAAGSFGTYDELPGGESVSYTFAEPGVFPYFCVLHPSMVGAVVVGDGQAGDGSGVSAATAAGGGDGGTGIGTIAAIVGAVGFGGAAVGLVGRRLLSARREERAAA
jgi:plastocyanin